jgi:hypothetical protein
MNTVKTHVSEYTNMDETKHFVHIWQQLGDVILWQKKFEVKHEVK